MSINQLDLGFRFKSRMMKYFWVFHHSPLSDYILLYKMLKLMTKFEWIHWFWCSYKAGKICNKDILWTLVKLQNKKELLAQCMLAQFKKWNLSHFKMEGVNYQQTLLKLDLIKFLVSRICKFMDSFSTKYIILRWTFDLADQLKNEILENWCATNIDENTVAQVF